jgi:hypothetical protein
LLKILAKQNPLNKFKGVASGESAGGYGFLRLAELHPAHSAECEERDFQHSAF